MNTSPPADPDRDSEVPVTVEQAGITGLKCRRCGLIDYPWQTFGCQQCGAYGTDLAVVSLSGHGQALTTVVDFDREGRPAGASASVLLDEGPFFETRLRPPTPLSVSPAAVRAVSEPGEATVHFEIVAGGAS